MNDDRPSFLRGAVRPMECFTAGWELIKNDYWLFLGITFVGSLIGSIAPLGILLGPMMCGIYYCLFRRANGKPVKFEMLFRGFDHFVPSLIATLLMMIPMIVILLPAYIAFVVAAFATAPKPGAQPNPSAMGTFLAAYGMFLLLIVLVSIVFHILFFFTYPLIVDRRVSGVEAVKTSLRAAWGNLGGVISVVLIDWLLSFAGSMCCVGQIFLLPIHFAAIAVAYKAVFPPDAPPEAPADGPAADYDDARLDAPPPESERGNDKS